MDRTSSQENYQTIITPPTKKKRGKITTSPYQKYLHTFYTYFWFISHMRSIEYFTTTYNKNYNTYQEVINKKIEILETSTFISSTIHEINPCKSVPMID